MWRGNEERGRLNSGSGVSCYMGQQIDMDRKTGEVDGKGAAGNCQSGCLSLERGRAFMCQGIRVAEIFHSLKCRSYVSWRSVGKRVEAVGIHDCTLTLPTKPSVMHAARRNCMCSMPILAVQPPDGQPRCFSPPAGFTEKATITAYTSSSRIQVPVACPHSQANSETSPSVTICVPDQLHKPDCNDHGRSAAGRLNSPVYMAWSRGRSRVSFGISKSCDFQRPSCCSLQFHFNADARRRFPDQQVVKVDRRPQ